MDSTQVVIEAGAVAAYRAMTRHQCEMPEGDDLRALVMLLNKISGGKVIGRADEF